MNPIFLLTEMSLLPEVKTALDIGARHGKIATQLAGKGISVDAIDIHDLPIQTPDFNFQKISVTDFLVQNTKQYDLVIARHVLHLLPNPVETMMELNAISDLFFFTCFGPKDDWFGKVSTLSHDEIMVLFPTASIRHHSEAFQYGKTYAGEMKFWHINTFVIDNRKQ